MLSACFFEKGSEIPENKRKKKELGTFLAIRGIADEAKYW
jgi:hypothetical protein